jgi:hypothetical protein
VRKAIDSMCTELSCPVSEVVQGRKIKLQGITNPSGATAKTFVSQRCPARRPAKIAVGPEKHSSIPKHCRSGMWRAKVGHYLKAYIQGAKEKRKRSVAGKS